MNDFKEFEFQATPVKKLSPGQLSRCSKLVIVYKELASELIDLCPDDTNRKMALAMLLQSKMMATQSVSHGMENET